MIAEMPPQAAYTRSVEPNNRVAFADSASYRTDERIKRAPVFRGLYELRQLRDNWDGEGSDAPRRELIATAIDLAVFLCDQGSELPDSAVASRSGTVVFTWREGPHYQEIEVVGLQSLEWMTIDAAGKATHGAFSLPAGSQDVQSKTSLSKYQRLTA